MNSQRCFVIGQQDNLMCGSQNHQVNLSAMTKHNIYCFVVCVFVSVSVLLLSTDCRLILVYLAQQVINCILIMHHYHLFNNLVACSKINTLQLEMRYNL